jgi:hypothetical protein
VNNSLNWQEAQRNFAPQFRNQLAAERGLKVSTFDRVAAWNGIGMVNAYHPKKRQSAWCVAFPVYDETCTVVRAHCRWPARDSEGKWEWFYYPYDPQQKLISALVYGKMQSAHQAFTVESQWDGLMSLEILDLFDDIEGGQVAMICTRGAQMGDRLAALAWREDVTIYAIPQNDKAGRKWLEDHRSLSRAVYVLWVPESYKDFNEWVKEGGAKAVDVEPLLESAPPLERGQDAEGQEAGKPGEDDLGRALSFSEELQRDFAAAGKETHQESNEREIREGRNAAQQVALREQSNECPYKAVEWESVRKELKSSAEQTGRFVQELVYPADSILSPYLEAARASCESADIYLLGAILPVVGALLGRRVWIEWGQEKMYPNLFMLLVGSAGMRKSSAVRYANRIALVCLGTESFLSERLSVEALFGEYCPEEGGCPDKLMVAEEANALLATWTRTDYGARVAAEFLKLYDCGRLSESFMRNKKKNSSPKRTIDETSTNALLGGTFKVATFPLEAVKEGIERRFLFAVAETLGRTLPWPEARPTLPTIDFFKTLLALSGPIYMPRQGDLWDRWLDYQTRNRAQLAQLKPEDEVLSARLASCPTHVLKIAQVFEVCRVVYDYPSQQLNSLSLQSLEAAIGFVEQHLRAAAFLDRYAKRKLASEQGELILATIRRDFPPQRSNTIYATRTELTRKFCMNTGRAGALTIEDLYLRVLPELQRQGDCALIHKEGKFEVYAFPTEKSI